MKSPATMNRRCASPRTNTCLLAAVFLASFLACGANSIRFSPSPHGNFGGLAGMNFFPHPCTPGWYQCADMSRCIERTWLCDGDRDCPDGSDERECELSPRIYIPGYRRRGWMDIFHRGCLSSHFQCADLSRCIDTSLLCDGDNDCFDGSDERECGLTPSINQPGYRRRGGMDIFHRGCLSSHFQCADLSRCIDTSLLCDGDNDCFDGSDERECGLTPSINQHSPPDLAHSYVETDCNLCQAPEQQPEFQPLMSFLSYHMNEILRENQDEQRTDLK